MSLVLATLEPIGLDALRADLALAERVERKYLTSVDRVEAVIERLAATHQALEIGGLREFRYRTTYYDSPDLLTLREHLQNRRQRFKCRRRFYLDSGTGVLEIKRKGLRGHTVKHAIDCDDRADLDPDDRAFLRTCLELTYGRRVPFELFRPTLTVGVRRITLASRRLEERVTFDVAVGIPGWRLADGLAIVETKSANGRGAADHVLRELGVHPRRCSKYCAGMALNEPGVRANAFRPLLRAFVPDGAPAPAGFDPMPQTA